jgi:hypothetical protein
MKQLSRRPFVETSADAPADDTALSELTAEDRDRLAMDAWEPSLLRRLIDEAADPVAQRKLKGSR